MVIQDKNPVWYAVFPQLLFQYPVSQSQPAPFYVGGPMGGIDGMAVTEPSQQGPPPAPMTPAPPPPATSCSAGPSPSSQGSETSFDCTHCGKSLRSRKNYSKHMFIHSGKFTSHSAKVRKYGGSKTMTGCERLSGHSYSGCGTTGRGVEELEKAGGSLACFIKNSCLIVKKNNSAQIKVWTGKIN